jgi:hypothetical protein
MNTEEVCKEASMLSTNPSPPPLGDDPRAWDAWIAAAPNFAVAQQRIEFAVEAGVDFAAMRQAQETRT